MNLESLAADATHATIRGRGGQVGQAISMLVPASPKLSPGVWKRGTNCKGPLLVRVFVPRCPPTVPPGLRG